MKQAERLRTQSAFTAKLLERQVSFLHKDNNKIVVIIGSDYTDVGSPAELGYNARIAVNIGAPVLLVLGGRAGQGRSEMLGTTASRTAADPPTAPASFHRSGIRGTQECHRWW